MLNWRFQEQVVGLTDPQVPKFSQLLPASRLRTVSLLEGLAEGYLVPNK